MHKLSVQCPACGSNKVKRHKKKSFGKITLGNEFTYDEIYYSCESCCEEGDFLGETEKSYLVCEKLEQKQLIEQILNEMKGQDLSMAMLERVFELPSRTLARWKSGDFSATTLALLRILITYPWIVEVAEKKFEKNHASMVLIKEAANKLQHLINCVPQSQIEKSASKNSNFVVYSAHTSIGA